MRLEGFSHLLRTPEASIGAFIIGASLLAAELRFGNQVDTKLADLLGAPDTTIIISLEDIPQEPVPVHLADIPLAAHRHQQALP